MSVPGQEKNLAQERRIAPRQTVAYRMDVLTADGRLGCLLDISVSGMRVFFKHGLDVSATQELRLEFPRWLELDSGLSVRGRFVWLRSHPEGGAEAGFSFDELSRKERGSLERLIERLAETVAADRPPPS